MELLTRENMAIQRQQREVEGGVGDARVWLEDGKDAKKTGDDEERLPPYPEAQPTHI